MNEVERRWQIAKSFPIWARLYIQAGLVREGAGLIAAFKDANKFSKRADMIREIFRSVDITIDEVTLKEIDGDFAVGIEHLDDIARRNGLLVVPL